MMISNLSHVFTISIGLRLSGEAFANVLMIYEFLHNFGETLGFDMESLPTMDSLQAAFLYDQEAEEELVSVVIHLVVVGIEDPGIPFFNKQLTLLGQNLRQADITNTNVSEILKVFLTARGQVEVKLLHNINPPDMLHAKGKTATFMIVSIYVVVVHSHPHSRSEEGGHVHSRKDRRVQQPFEKDQRFQIRRHGGRQIILVLESLGKI